MSSTSSQPIPSTPVSSPSKSALQETSTLIFSPGSLPNSTTTASDNSIDSEEAPSTEKKSSQKRTAKTPSNTSSKKAKNDLPVNVDDPGFDADVQRETFKSWLHEELPDESDDPVGAAFSEIDAASQEAMATAAEAKKKGTVTARLLDICTEHEITSMNALARYCNLNPVHRPFLVMARTNAYSQIFEAVKSMLTQAPLYPRIKFVDDPKPQESKIHKLLMFHGLNEEQVKNFAVNLYKVMERLTGKRNTFVLWGSSNSGKSQLMETFCRTYFSSAIGMPTNNQRSSFPWGNCPNNRVLLWEEPLITIDNVEDFKKIGGGQSHHVDVKYQTHVEIEHTPMIITSNKPLWANFSSLNPGARDEIKNRCYFYRLFKTIPEESKPDFFPIKSADWHYYLSIYKTEFEALYNDVM